MMKFMVHKCFSFIARDQHVRPNIMVDEVEVKTTFDPLGDCKL